MKTPINTKKTLGIIIDSKSELENFLNHNLNEIFQNSINLKFYYLNNMDRIHDCDLILVMIKERILSLLPYISDTSIVLPVKKTLSRKIYRELKNILNHPEILVVNDTLETTMDLTSSIYQLGINHFRLIPYVEGVDFTNINFAITAKEEHLIPPNFDYLDIGYRPIDISTILEIFSCLDIPMESYMSELESYTNKYVTLEKNVSENIRLKKTVKKLSSVLKSQVTQKGYYAQYNFEDIKTYSSKVKSTISKAKKLAKHDINIMITGETGTGKEMFAQSIHNHSDRASYPFIGINVTAIPSSLLESELFGYVEGAFTGARKNGHRGIFEQCNGGTLFLDEIGDMPISMQTKLLRALEERRFIPVGGSSFIEFDVRLISATNKNLKKEIAEGLFREDLYYRLKSALITLTPLRERITDLDILLETFLKNDSLHLTNLSEKILKSYSWHGNIRELKNACDYISIMLGDTTTITVDHLPDDIVCEYETNSKDTLEIASTDLDKIFENTISLNHNPDKIKSTLEAINKLSLETASSGRYSVRKLLLSDGFNISDSEMKNIFKSLNDSGLIICSRGRKGASLTHTGKRYLNSF